MKKSIRKPINWQDFESLCKILWGEIWEISDKIKKNGRLGQLQAGVDIYGVPKGKIKYSAIQCKGKDDYSNALLTEKEINAEIEKAKTFKPELESFIFATTANKDAVIEQYIREKDIESRNNGGFEILIYCWEDIADLIETNRNTFNYYVLENQFKSNFEFDFSFKGGEKEFIIRPRFTKNITKYKLRKKVKETDHPEIKRLFEIKSSFKEFNAFSPIKNVNTSWATFSITFANTGSEVLEDYKLYIYPEENKFRDLSGYLGNILERIDFLKYSPLYVFDEEKYALYKPKDNSPLIQKDSKTFDLHILSNHEAYQLKIEYEILARDFNQEGELLLIVEPTYETKEQIIWVDNEEEVMNDIITYEDNMIAGGLF